MHELGIVFYIIRDVKEAALENDVEHVNAVVSASERPSAWLKASYFQNESEQLALLEQQPMLAFEKDFLRWMLSDGAFALLLQGKPNGLGLSLRIDWIELTSFAGTLQTCMYAGAEKLADGRLKGWADYPQQEWRAFHRKSQQFQPFSQVIPPNRSNFEKSQQEWLDKSLFALKQDTRLLAANIVKRGVDFLLEMGKKHGFTPDDIDWFLPHLSSMFFKDKILEESRERRFLIPEDKWFLNLPHIGNIGSASAFAMIEELFGSGRLRKGQKILLMVPESARFSYCYCMLTVV